MSLGMSNVEKAAAILVCLGVEKAAQVLTHLAHEEVQVLANQMAQTGTIPLPSRDELLAELHDRYRIADLEISSGGLAFVQRLLAETFGEERAAFVMEQLTQHRATRPFRLMRAVDAHRILEVIASEQPGVIALVTYYLPREKAAQVLAGLAENVRHQVVMRLVNLQTPMPHLVARLEQILAQKLSDTSGDSNEDERDIGTVKGARTLVEILGHSDAGVEKGIYEFLQEHDPELAEEVRKSMFVFEDITRLDTRHLQLVLREIQPNTTAVALKGTTDELRDLVLSNVSANVAKMISEEAELLGPVPLSQVEEARQAVISVVRRMADEGTISLRPAAAEEMVV